MHTEPNEPRHLTGVDRQSEVPAASPSGWLREGEAMYDAGLELRSIAEQLPATSPTRDSMWACAESWLLQAALRGFALPRLQEA